MLLLLLALACTAPSVDSIDASPPALDDSALDDSAAPADWWSVVSGDIGAEVAGIHHAEGSFRSVDPTTGLRADYDNDGVSLRVGLEQIEVRTSAVGRESGTRPLPLVDPIEGGCVAAARDCLPRLDFPREGLTEWWVSRPGSLEVGWDLDDRPDGVGLVVIDVTVSGGGVEPGADDESLLILGHGGGQLGVSGLRAWDDLGEPLEAWMEATPEGLRVLVDDEGASWPIHVDPVLSSYSWYAMGSTSSSYLGWSVAMAGDVNADGYDDVIVGAPYYSSYTGRAYVYHGSSSGLSYSATTTITGGSTSYYLGYAVDGAGDVNADGYDDVIVGAYYYNSGYGAAYIHHGSSSGISSSASRTITGSTSYRLGQSVAGAGDVNYDGYDDVIIGAPGYSSGTGRAYVHHGSSSGVSSSATTTITGASTSYYLGYDVDGAGSVNGDRYADVIVGAYGYSSYTGRAYVHHGSSTGVSSSATSTLSGSTSSEYFSLAVAGIGDTNGDGYDDVAVGAPYYSSYSGRVAVYRGASSGVSTTASTNLYGSSSTYFGYAIDGAGDTDADGYDDLAVGAYYYSSGYGLVEVYQGSSSGLASSAESSVTGFSTSHYLGRAVGGAGDVNGDGYADIIAGGYYYSSGYGLATNYLGYEDADGDGYVLGGDGSYPDCDDTDATVYPYATETTGDGIDSDCDDLETCYYDADNDGYLASTATTVSSADTDCSDSYEGLASDPFTDCDDASSADNPGASETTANGDDENCDGYELCYDDDDNDGYLDTTGDTRLSTDSDCSDSYEGTSSDATTDCDDSDAGDYPSAAETTGNGDDENCDGAETCYDDDDNDGYLDTTGDTRSSSDADCSDAYEGLSTDATTDCDDSSSSDNPGATETTGNGDDENCDGTETCYDDDDNDGYLDTTGDTRASTDTDCTDSYEGTTSDATTDCDDSDAGDYPGATETTGNSDDENCDGAETCYTDADSDSYAVSTTLASSDTDCSDSGEGTATEYAAGPDCNDGSSSIRPGATETTGDEVDYNCDGAETCYTDDDGDGYATSTTRSSTDTDCSDSGEATSTAYALGADCDDTSTAENPGATEVCDASNTDEDCSGAADDNDSGTDASTKTTWYRDSDSDGHGGTAASTARCEQPSGYVSTADDCDDTNANISPSDTEVTGTGGDENCDGLAACYTDADADGYASSTVVESSDSDCTDAGEANTTVYGRGTDCDDGSSSINPSATETCDAADDDEDCDSLADDDDSSASNSSKTTFYPDDDGDGYGSESGGVASCDAPSGWVSTGGDCNDGDASVNTGASEVTGDEVDSDCDGSESCYADADADGYSPGSTTTSSDADCGDAGEASLSDYLLGADCDDASAAVSPAGSEVCDGANADEDCDGVADDDDPSATGQVTMSPDDDGDNYGDDARATSACDHALGWAASGGDCDDTDADINPSATEVCDARDTDEDCDGYVDDEDATVDPATLVVAYTDGDGDGYGADGTEHTLCDPRPGDALVGGDCDDQSGSYFPGAPETDCTDPSDYNCDGFAGSTDNDGDGYAACEECDDGSATVNPRASEVCNDVDDDCDGITDGGTAIDADVWYPDGDGDGYGGSNGVTDCDQPEGHVAESGDCDDGNAAVSPGAEESCNELDDDCDGTVDGASVCVTAEDTGGDKYEPEPPPEGCGCNTGASGGVLALVATAMMVRRRR